MIGIYILSTSLFYLVLLTIVYFSKKRFLNTENKIFKMLLLSNLGGIILDVLSMVIIPLTNGGLLSLIINKLYLVYLLTWITLFTFYTFFVSKYDHNWLLKKINLFKMIFIAMILLILILPLEFVISDKGVYSYGGSTLIIYLYSIVCIFLMILMLLKNIKRIEKKKYIPILSFLGIGSLVIGIQVLNPYLLLMTAMESFITFLMYFTIENPDLQIVEEYREIKKIAKKQNIDKVMFLHTITQNLKYNLLDIERNVNYLTNVIKENEYRDSLENIDYQTKKMLSLLTKVYDPNLINESTIKPFNDNYETKSYISIFKSYCGLMPENIKYTWEIDQNIPNYLYGDILNIKEILKKIIKETIVNISKGYIKINLNTVIDDNVCRLIISIKDNGKGYLFNEIEASLKDGLFKQYNDDLSKVNGIFIINSEKDALTEKIVVIDQLISLKDVKKLDKIDDKTNKKKIMIVDNSELTNAIIKYAKRYDAEIVSVNYGVECLKRIREYEKYDLIIMNEDLEPLSGIEIYKKLKENIIFKVPVILLSKNKDFRIKDGFLQLGINEIINVPFSKEEVLKVLEKYLNNKNNG